jgi:4-amino-4-deoxy-L-arabinose transferase-like glycosyltransferase
MSEAKAQEQDTRAARSSWLIGLLCLVAFILRLLYAGRSGLWRDEALFLFVVRLPTLGDLFDFLRLHESHPPLFYLLERAWLAIFGTSDPAALALPILFGVALVPAIYGVGARVFSPRAGLLAAALAACSPILAEHAALVRPYSLVPLLVLLGTFALWRGLLGGTTLAWGAYGALAAGLLLTHNFGWVVFGAWGLLGGIWLVANGTRSRLQTAAGFLVAHLGVLMLYAPWAPNFLFQVRHAGHAPHPVSSLSIPLTLFAKTFSSIPNPYAGAAVLCIAAIACAQAAKRGGPSGDPDAKYAYRLAFWLFGLIPLLVFAVSVAGSAYSDLLWPRTLLAVVPCALLAMSEGVAALLPRARTGLGLLTVALAGAYLAISMAMLALPKSNAREVAGAVMQRARPDDLVIISPEWLASGFNYYFVGQNRQIDYPHEGREGATPFDDLARRIGDPKAFLRVKGELALQRQHNGRIWLIADYGGLLPGLPPGDEIPADVPATHWNGIGVVRTSQLARELQRLYGRPKAQVVTAHNSSGAENLTAILYEPPLGPVR